MFDGLLKHQRDERAPSRSSAVAAGWPMKSTFRRRRLAAVLLRP
jgi:hypothetical protein